MMSVCRTLYIRTFIKSTNRTGEVKEKKTLPSMSDINCPGGGSPGGGRDVLYGACSG